MAFETPLAPGGLHFYFGPSGVKLKSLVVSDGPSLMVIAKILITIVGYGYHRLETLE